MIELLFLSDAYRREAPGKVVASGPEGIVLEASLFYAASGGQPGDTGRLDWERGSLAVRDAVKAEGGAVEAALGDLVARDVAVTAEWVDEAVLDATPALVKTLSVRPPRGAGRVRLVRIGEGDGTADLQPCGGTHVARTGEIGPLRLGKIQKKGRQNRRVSILLT